MNMINRRSTLRFIFTLITVFLFSSIYCDRDDKIVGNENLPVEENMSTVRFWVNETTSGKPSFHLAGKQVSSIKLIIDSICVLPSDELDTYCQDNQNHIEFSYFNQSLINSNGDLEFDILDLTENINRYSLGYSQIPEGTYIEIQYAIKTVGNYLVIDGERYPLKLSNNQNVVRISYRFDMVANQILSLYFDFVASESIKYQPGEGYVLNPVIIVTGDHQIGGPYEGYLEDGTQVNYYLDIEEGDYYIFDDIIIGDIENGIQYLVTPSSSLRNNFKDTIRYSFYRDWGRHWWPMNNIPYYFDDTGRQFTIDEQELIRQALASWEEAVPTLDFYEISDPSTVDHYIRFTRSRGESCRTLSLGFHPLIEKHVIKLGDDCLDFADSEATDFRNYRLNMGTIAHEIGHRIGLMHEHQRGDRDDYITVPSARDRDNDWDCSRANRMGRPSNDGYIGGSYDFDSIMHYSLQSCGSMTPVVPVPQQICCRANPSDPTCATSSPPLTIEADPVCCQFWRSSSTSTILNTMPSTGIQNNNFFTVAANLRQRHHLSCGDIVTGRKLFPFFEPISFSYSNDSCSPSEDLCDGPVGFADVNGDGIADFWGWEHASTDDNIVIKKYNTTTEEYEQNTIKLFEFGKERCSVNEAVCDGPVGFANLGGDLVIDPDDNSITRDALDFWGLDKEGNLWTSISNGADGTFPFLNKVITNIDQDSSKNIHKCTDNDNINCWGPFGFKNIGNPSLTSATTEDDFWVWKNDMNIKIYYNNRGLFDGLNDSSEFRWGQKKCDEDEEYGCDGPIGFINIDSSVTSRLDFWGWKSNGDIEIVEQTDNPLAKDRFTNSRVLFNWGGTDVAKCSANDSTSCWGPIGFDYIGSYTNENDEWADFWGWNESGDIEIILSDGGIFTPGSAITLEWDDDKCRQREAFCSGPIGFTDINGDGLVDFWGWSSHHNSIRIRLNMGQGNFASDFHNLRMDGLFAFTRQPYKFSRSPDGVGNTSRPMLGFEKLDANNSMDLWYWAPGASNDDIIIRLSGL